MSFASCARYEHTTCTVPGRGHILQEDPQLPEEDPLEMPKASDADKENFRSALPDHAEEHGAGLPAKAPKSQTAPKANASRK